MRREELYLADLIDNARAVRGYLDGVTRERWDAEGILRGPRSTRQDQRQIRVPRPYAITVGAALSG
jgi:hypothetical protein